MLKKLFSGSAITILLAIVADVLNRWTEIAPGVELPPWLYPIVTLAALYLPSIFGVAHRQAHGEAQEPSKRTAAELVSATVAVAEKITEAAAPGTSVAVPAVTTAYVNAPAKEA